jgi:hypothetical protein
MMNTVYFDSPANDEVRRKRLYEGQLFVYGPRPSTLKLVHHAREMIEKAFGKIDPRDAQYHMPVEKYVEVCTPLKPGFIHHPETKKIIQEVLREFQCDMQKTYLDVPRLRMVTSDGYLTSGVGYAHHPHRDTWYSAPMSQINWWLPIYDIETEQSMAFHPHYFNKPIKNGSKDFNYYEWNATSRKDAAKHIKSDTRKQPKPEEDLQLQPEVRFVMPAGGVVLFSATHLHSTVANNSGKARYSIDFRTVNLDDVKAKGGAKNLDSHCTGTSLRDFMRGTDLARMDEAVVALHDDTPAPDEFKVFKPELATSVK